MKQALLAAALALGLLSFLPESALANGSKGFGIGIGLSFDFGSWSKCGPQGNCGYPGGCLPPPGWSPYYAPPMMWGGMYGYNPYGAYPPVSGFPFVGGHGGYGGYGGAEAGVHPGGGGYIVPGNIPQGATLVPNANNKPTLPNPSGSVINTPPATGGSKPPIEKEKK
ncbi:MAG: hypothetical protein U0840_06625 [Gemmataceae bacterium]